MNTLTRCALSSSQYAARVVTRLKKICTMRSSANALRFFTMHDLTLYHHPRCSKSRAAPTSLQNRGVMSDVVDCLTTPLNVPQLLRARLTALNLDARTVLRAGE